MAEKEIKKKQVRKAASKKAVSKSVSTTKKPATKRVAKKSVTRKAPTLVAATLQDNKKNKIIVGVGIFVFMSVVGVSIVLGVSGDGAISIDEQVANMKENATPEERSRIESIPAQKKPVRDGGLVPSGVPVEKPKPKPEATPVDIIASTTEAAASSTPEVAEETQEEEGTQEEDLSESADPIQTEEGATEDATENPSEE